MKTGAVAEDEILDEVVENADGAAQDGAEDADGKAAADKTADKAAPVIDPAEYKRVTKELKESRKLQRESDEAARFWSEKAKEGKPAPAAAAADDAEEVDLVDLITTKGLKGLDEVLAKRGYVKAKDVERSISSTRTEITEQAALIAAYPELNDESSPFFKATAKIYNSLKEDPHMAKSPKLIATAARLAKAEMGAPGRRRDPDPDLDDDADDDEADAHAARVARQSGDRGRRANGNEPERLSDSQKSIVAKFAAVGGEITEEIYRKQAQSGVRMGGLPNRQRQSK